MKDILTLNSLFLVAWICATQLRSPGTEFPMYVDLSIIPGHWWPRQPSHLSMHYHIAFLHLSVSVHYRTAFPHLSVHYLTTFPCLSTLSRISTNLTLLSLTSYLISSSPTPAPSSSCPLLVPSYSPGQKGVGKCGWKPSGYRNGQLLHDDSSPGTAGRATPNAASSLEMPVQTRKCRN